MMNNKLVALALALPVVLLFNNTSIAEEDIASAFYTETSKACDAEMSQDKEIQQYKGMSEFVCPCMLKYLKSHYTTADIEFMTDYTVKKEAKNTITAAEDTRYNSLLEVASDSGKSCATEFFTLNPPTGNN